MSQCTCGLASFKLLVNYVCHFHWSQPTRMELPKPPTAPCMTLGQFLKVLPISASPSGNGGMTLLPTRFWQDKVKLNTQRAGTVFRVNLCSRVCVHPLTVENTAIKQLSLLKPRTQLGPGGLRKLQAAAVISHHVAKGPGCP